MVKEATEQMEAYDLQRAADAFVDRYIKKPGALA
jgi:hypothetical protein